MSSRNNNRITKNKIKKDKLNDNHKLTEYFSVRRSTRRTAEQLKFEENEKIRSLIETGYYEDYLRIYETEEKGRGIKAGRRFKKDDFVVEYRGEILTAAEGKKREQEYAQNSLIGSYMYFFEHRNQRFCVDATAESQYKGRLVNHSFLKPNLKSRVVELPNSIHLCLFAKRDIDIGEELVYDYGERRTNAIAYNPWLKQS
ncbi:unnamed protein product [Bursaphelenchus okinawaensis]|uniref:[histone H4]-lysine(20) N-methyltransferase n=1 Tax=Bursaphelenchus okinawaensis TaxID=465554 RepID=A0A811KIK5_9BILA|nr:unnamed protein product [Bursaphelenchus okinawaensis]CAG9103892.1 unnamed protein product [Bursaphelenchus okinawaensis]